MADRVLEHHRPSPARSFFAFVEVDEDDDWYYAIRETPVEGVADAPWSHEIAQTHSKMWAERVCAALNAQTYRHPVPPAQPPALGERDL